DSRRRITRPSNSWASIGTLSTSYGSSSSRSSIWSEVTTYGRNGRSNTGPCDRRDPSASTVHPGFRDARGGDRTRTRDHDARLLPRPRAYLPNRPSRDHVDDQSEPRRRILYASSILASLARLDCACPPRVAAGSSRG